MFLAPGFLLNMKTGVFGSPAENPSGVPQRHQNTIQTPNYRVLPDLVTAQVFASSLPSLPCFLCSLREPCSLIFKMLLCLPTVPFFTITPHLWSGWVPLILCDLAQSLLLAKNKKKNKKPYLDIHTCTQSPVYLPFIKALIIPQCLLLVYLHQGELKVTGPDTWYSFDKWLMNEWMNFNLILSLLCQKICQALKVTQNNESVRTWI